MVLLLDDIDMAPVNLLPVTTIISPGAWVLRNGTLGTKTHLPTFSSSGTSPLSIMSFRKSIKNSLKY